MKKRNCYPKAHYYTLLIATILSGASIIVFPLTFFRDGETRLKIVVALVFLLLAVVNLARLLWENQVFYIENGEIAVKNCFGVIKKLNVDECFFMTAKLKDGDAETGGVEDWICIYTRDNTEPFFEEGFSNKKKYNRIQVINTKENLEYVRAYIKDGGVYTKPILEEKISEGSK